MRKLLQGGIFLECYDVYLGQDAVGKAYVSLQGLYYRIQCRCAMSSQVMHRLVITCGEQQESLGVLIPFGQEFGLDTRIAVKRIGEGVLRFKVLPKHTSMEEFVPLSPEEPFAYLRRLRSSYLVRKNGRFYAAWKE